VMYRGASRSIVINAVLASLLIAGTGQSFAARWAWGWLACLLTVYGLRMMVARRFFRASAAEQHDRAAGWRRAATATATLGGLTWAVGIAIVWSGANPGDQLLTVMVISGLLPGATSSLASIPLAFAGYALPIAVVITGSLASRASTASEWVAAVGSAALFPLLFRSARTMFDELERSTRMGLEQANLLRQLERARDAAVASAGARSEFLSVMSHELRTPLNGVVGLTTLLLDGARDADQRELAQGARDSAQMLLELINGVLDLSKIDAGHVELEDSDFSLRQELERLRVLLELRAREKGLSLTLELAEDVPARARGDWFRLRQVLVNLVGNALKFTDRGGVTCRVRAAQGPGLRLAFEVQDSGIGMTAGQRQKLFQPFVQADASTTRRFGGTGLGLIISKRLVELMQGTVTVESTEGVGSTFRFEISLAPASAPAAVPTLAPAGLAMHGERVLVCDDNEINLKVAGRLLERAGYAVVMRRNGAEALQVLETVPVDVVLMDLQMPVMDGFEALQRARAPTTRLLDAAVPFVAVTASATVAEQQACRAAGFDAFLSKPIEPAQLIRTLAEVCSRRRLRSEASARTA
jgi:signal transduction histidine kinase/CheY-like chemotaxis protein